MSHFKSLSLFLQEPCLYLYSFSYNISTYLEGKCEQKLPSNFPTDSLIPKKKNHNILEIMGRNLQILLSTYIDQRGLLPPM